ncbi:MAG TPA: class I SAM-dependent methyltransferase [Pyrinomonadaceae bacterium]|nr:class I SAM-dependent methyltransferase [Pyrinomonadaceae bacterium]
MDLYEFRHESEKKHAVQSMQAYVRNKPEQVKLFEELIAPYLKENSVSVLDACCGMGDLIYFLSQLNPDAHFTGIDKAEFLINEARALFPDNSSVEFKQGDIYALAEQFGGKSFDLSTCKQTLSWLPGYEKPIQELMTVTRRAVFVSSLFYDGRIDFETRVREYTTESGRDGYNAFYNVYSFPIFREFCIGNGARDVVGFDFHIGIDLPQPANPDRMGTYTVQLQTGERLQISGALLMPWKIVRIDL